MTVYQLMHIKDPASNGAQHLVAQINSQWRGAMDASLRHYGLFHGLFGMATNELYWVTESIAPSPTLRPLIENAGFQVIDQVNLMPTVRPVEFNPPEAPGVYVFRWFRVKNSDVDEIADLSDQAWHYFEGGFDTQIQGLFAELDRSPDVGKMVLLTWYKDLSVWEDSRNPSEEARALFTKRHALTIEAIPIPTRLIL